MVYHMFLDGIYKVREKKHTYLYFMEKDMRKYQGKNVVLYHSTPCTPQKIESNFMEFRGKYLMAYVTMLGHDDWYAILCLLILRCMCEGPPLKLLWLNLLGVIGEFKCGD